MADEVATPVRFYVKRDAIAKLRARAAQIDNEDHGEHLAEYTVPQALIVVFHNDPDFLFGEILNGWVCEPSDDPWQGARWIPEETPEGHIIEEDPL